MGSWERPLRTMLERASDAACPSAIRPVRHMARPLMQPSLLVGHLKTPIKGKAKLNHASTATAVNAMQGASKLAEGHGAGFPDSQRVTMGGGFCEVASLPNQDLPLIQAQSTGIGAIGLSLDPAAPGGSAPAP